MTGAPRGAAWAGHLEQFAAAREAEGVAPATVAGHVRRVRRFAVFAGVGPGEVDEQRAAAWLAAGSSEATAKANRLALRAFFDWAQAAGIVAAHPVPRPAAVTRYAVPARWADALEAFEVAQARQLGAATVAQRVKHVRRFAAEHAAEPWRVEAEDVAAWLDSLEVADATRRAMRLSLRAFYRWARDAGRIATDPTAEPDGRHALRLEVPATWAGPLREYRAAMLAAGRSPASIAARMGHLERFARDHARLEPWAVTLADLLEWLAGHAWAAETRRGNRGSLRDFYRWAEDVGHLEASPAARLPVIRPAPPSPRPASAEDYRAALARADERDALALRLACELGLRRAEVARVHSSDLARDAGGWWLTVHGKGSRERAVPLPDGLAEALRALPPGHAFPGQDAGHLSPRYLGKRVSALLPPGVTMHALRHSFATRAYGIDRDVFSVQRLLGHASPATTARYVATPSDRLRGLVLAANDGRP